MKKKLLASVFVVMLCALCAFSVLTHASDADVIVSLQIDNPLMEVNGVEAEIDIGRGTRPIVNNGRTLVPIRAIIEAFDGSVTWNGNTQTVLLTMENDTIRLVIDSNTAYLNESLKTLDVAPTIVNGRTMLPIRFIAEGFNLGVAWNPNTQTVSLIRNTFDKNEHNALMTALPEYSGQPYTKINNNEPFFKDYEIINASFEYYSDLDALGRCDVCFASVAKDLMPTEPRKSISSVTPTGWINAKYDIVPGGYLYNRCHLIGFQLTGENANKRNLITGTRFLNINGMLPFENSVADYINETGNRVMYRITPVFTEDNLLARGVLMEAYSVEDRGAGISFCVFCYNVQPQIFINYATGENCLTGDTVQNESVNDSETIIVYRTPSGKKYHYSATCGGKNSYSVTFVAAVSAGLAPCTKCAN